MDLKSQLIAEITKRVTRLRPYELDTIAEGLIEAGFKREAWISVQESVPEEGQHVLATGYLFNDPLRGRWKIVAKFHDGGFKEFIVDEMDFGEGGFWGKKTTNTDHWQPLPEDIK